MEARAEDIDYALKPENIERSTAGYGTTRPEELREQRRKQLENEKERVRKQLDQLAASRTRLEQAIATSDRLLICSDGLSAVVAHERLEAIFTEARPLEETCQQLIDAANDAGGPDNITAIILNIDVA